MKKHGIRRKDVKSKIVAVSVALALVLSLAFALAGPVSAAPTSWNVTGNWVIAFTLTGGTSPVSEYSVTLAQSGSSVSGSGSSSIYIWSSITGSVSGNLITFTATYASGSGPTPVTLNGTITATGMSGSWNEGSWGSGTWVTTSGQAYLMTSSAGNTVSGTMGTPSVTVTAPGDLNLGTLDTLGTNGPVGSTGSVATVLATDWNVTASVLVQAKATKGVPGGYLPGAMSDGNGIYLTEPLSISKDPTQADFVSATSTLEWDDVTSFNFYAEQTISQADVALGQAGDTFSIEIIFTGNFVD
jgi:hypothetical protein